MTLREKIIKYFDDNIDCLDSLEYKGGVFSAVFALKTKKVEYRFRSFNSAKEVLKRVKRLKDEEELNEKAQG